MTRARTDASDEADALSLTGNRCGMRRGVHRRWLNQRLNKRESVGGCRGAMEIAGAVARKDQGHSVRFFLYPAPKTSVLAWTAI